jgi:hypothetical protein
MQPCDILVRYFQGGLVDHSLCGTDVLPVTSSLSSPSLSLEGDKELSPQGFMKLLQGVGGVGAGIHDPWPPLPKTNCHCLPSSNEAAP